MHFTVLDTLTTVFAYNSRQQHPKLSLCMLRHLYMYHGMTLSCSLTRERGKISKYCCWWVHYVDFPLFRLWHTLFVIYCFSNFLVNYLSYTCRFVGIFNVLPSRNLYIQSFCVIYGKPCITIFKYSIIVYSRAQRHCLHK